MAIDDAVWALQELRRRHPSVSLALSYFEGEHRLNFATPKFKEQFEQLFTGFALNLCGVVVTTLADRLEIDGWQSKGSDEQHEAAADIWDANRMGPQAHEVHEESFITGTSYVMVWPVDSTVEGEGEEAVTRREVRITPQTPLETIVRYDDEDPLRALYAVKAWREVAGKDGDSTTYRWFLNIYYPDAIEKYERPPSKETGIPSSVTQFSQTEVIDNPFDVVPVVEFPNSHGLGRLGVSELRDVVPVQDTLNLAAISLITATDVAGFPQRVLIGVESESDETGKPIEPTTSSSRTWILAGEAKDIAVHQFDAADLNQLVATKNDCAKDVGMVSGTPLYLLVPTSEPPSGESLKVAEGRQVKKAEKRQKSWGPQWGEVVRMALLMSGADKPDAGTLTPVWRSAETRSVTEELDAAAKKKSIGIPFDQILLEMGYPKSEVDRLVKAKEDADQRSAELAAQRFSAGDFGAAGSD